jgi:Predicted drug exporters of the RND superfamily
MYFVGSKVFNGLASATIAVIVCAVVGSVTVLPAVLELLGPRIDRGRIPFLPHLHTDSSKSRFWPAVIDRVLRRPALSVALSAGLLVVLALPALDLRFSKPSDNALSSQSEPEVATFNRIRAAFPGTSEAAIVVIAGPRSAEPPSRLALGRLEALAVSAASPIARSRSAPVQTADLARSSCP